MKYPDYFPVNCPPKDACAEEVTAYRMCKTDNIDRSDFQSYYEMGKDFGNNVNGYGVSVLSDIKEASVLAKMPAHRKDYLAQGCTASICGEILRTPSKNKSSHITWWLYEDATPEKYFK